MPDQPTRPRSRLCALVCAAVLGGLAAPAVAIEDPRANDAADLFVAMCLGHPDGGAFARQTFEPHPEMAKPMTGDELADVLGGMFRPGPGWVMPTPNGGQVILAYAPPQRTCAIIVRAADAEGMQSALTAGVRAFAATLGGTAEPGTDETLTVAGVKVARVGWLITANDRRFAVMGSLGERPSGGRQHLLTLTILR